MNLFFFTGGCRGNPTVLRAVGNVREMDRHFSGTVAKLPTLLVIFWGNKTSLNAFKYRYRLYGMVYLHA